MESLRIGVLGAARISEWPIVEQARVTGMRLVAVAAAARDRGRAQSFASAHGFERVHASYADVTADPSSDDLFHDTIHHRVRCGAGVLDVQGLITTLQLARVIGRVRQPD